MEGINCEPETRDFVDVKYHRYGAIQKALIPAARAIEPMNEQIRLTVSRLRLRMRVEAKNRDPKPIIRPVSGKARSSNNAMVIPPKTTFLAVGYLTSAIIE